MIDPVLAWSMTVERRATTAIRAVSSCHRRWAAAKPLGHLVVAITSTPFSSNSFIHSTTVLLSSKLISNLYLIDELNLMISARSRPDAYAIEALVLQHWNTTQPAHCQANGSQLTSNVIHFQFHSIEFQWNFTWNFRYVEVRTRQPPGGHTSDQRNLPGPSLHAQRSQCTTRQQHSRWVTESAQVGASGDGPDTAATGTHVSSGSGRHFVRTWNGIRLAVTLI